MKKSKAYAFSLGKRKYFYRNEKIELFYNVLFLLLGAVEFYFMSIIAYALIK